MRSRSRILNLPSVLPTLVLIANLALVTIFLRCGPRAGTQRPELQGGVELYSLLGTSFERVWIERTIVLGAQSPVLGVQSSRGGGFPMSAGGRSEEPFPLIVKATIIDSALVEAGIQAFGRLADMDATSLEAFRSSYRKRHQLDEYVLVYVEMQTSLSEEYLKPDRWVFFLEDERRNQIEPRRIVEFPIRGRMSQRAPRFELDTSVQPFGPGGFSPVQQILGLYFPLARVPQANRSLQKTEPVKFVVLDLKDSKIRAEATWNFGAMR